MKVKHVLGGVAATAALAVAVIAGHNSPPAAQPAQGQTCFYHGALPDAGCTPGAIDPRVTQENIQQTICVSGYTATVRPPVSVTNAIKAEQMVAYGVGGADPKTVEEDHMIPLEVGGAPRDPTNLWPQPWEGTYGAHTKDKVENAAHAAVCNGQITLAQAQAGIAADWVALGRELGAIQ